MRIKIQRIRLVSAVAASTMGCILLLHLLFIPLFPQNAFSLWRQWAPWNAAVGEKLITENLAVLVKGEEDQRKLRSTGFSCQRDVHAHVCLSSTQVRIQTQDSQELQIYQPYVKGSSSAITIKPYARQEDKFAMEIVRPAHILYGTVYDIPRCNVSHNVPAIVFSSGGYAGNLFHGFSESIVPLFLTSHHFDKQVQFVTTNEVPFLFDKYKSVLSHLSDYDLITLQDKRVHCFPGAIVGLKFHRNLGINSTQVPKGYDISQFREFLRESYNLTASTVTQFLIAKAKPFLLLISRRGSRVFLNEDEMVAMMTLLGYDVIVADPSMTEDLDRFSKIVNKCSVIVGAHGAGMTNLVFLPAGAVVVQVVPLGLDYLSEVFFGEPARNMDLKYKVYKIDSDESSLLDTYSRDDPVITDPLSVFLKDAKVHRNIYFDAQNLKINLVKFRETLIEVQKILNISR